jgi:two-component system chemotaxis response regulator CheY
MRLLMRVTLQKLGFQVSEAANGREGLARLDTERPDVVMVDWHMPEMDGAEFVQAVRARPDLAGLRLVVVTGETDAVQVGKVAATGADTYVSKPFTPETIRERLGAIGVMVA